MKIKCTLLAYKFFYNQLILLFNKTNIIKIFLLGRTFTVYTCHRTIIPSCSYCSGEQRNPHYRISDMNENPELLEMSCFRLKVDPKCTDSECMTLFARDFYIL